MKWTDAEVTVLTMLIREGNSYSDIATRMNRSLSSITAKAKRLRLGTMRWTDIEVETLTKLMQEGNTRAGIATRMNRSLSSIKGKAKKLGLVSLNNGRKWSLKDVEILKNEINNGLTAEEVAGILSRTPAAIALKCLAINIKSKNNIRYTNEEYIAFISSIGNYIVLEDYVNSYTKILHKHLTCGTSWKVTPSSVRTGTGCPYCANIKRRILCGSKDANLIDIAKSIEDSVYIIESSVCIKVGISRNIPVRIKKIAYDTKLSWKLLCQFKTNTWKAIQIENIVKRNYIRYKIDYKFDGYTELYNLEDFNAIKKTIMKEIQNDKI